VEIGTGGVWTKHPVARGEEETGERIGEKGREREERGISLSFPFFTSND
jgi:hypothetical protein